MSAWWIVFGKELRETLRDRRTLLTMIVVPVLLYPVLLVASEQILLFGMRRIEEGKVPVAVVGDASGELSALLAADTTLRVVPVTDAGSAVRTDSAAAVAILGPRGEDGSRPVTVVYDQTSDRSQRGRRELGAVLDVWRDTLLARRLEEHGLAPGFVHPVAVADSSVSRPREVGGYTLGKILPLLLVVITLLGTFYPAIDLAAGEKERGTLETLLTAPVHPGAVVAGKFATVALIGVVAAALNLGSMLLTFQTGMVQLTRAVGLDVSIPLGSVVVIFAALVPLAVLFGALFLGLAVRASSFKEAQNALTPVYMIVLLPAMLPIFPGIDFGPLLAVTPVAGVSFLFRDLMIGRASLGLGVAVIASTAVYAALALVFAARRFGDESILFGSDDDDPSGPGFLERALARPVRGRVPSRGAAVLFVALVAVLYFWVGITLQVRLGERGLLLSEWLLLFVPAVLFVRLWGYDARATLSLRAPAPRALLAAVLIAGGTLPLGWLVGWLQTFVLPVPWEMLRGLEDLITAKSPGRLAWLLLLVAVTPAVCEELVFRGVLLGGTRRLDTWRVLLLNGIIFGAFHLSFETAIRFLPTALLGIVIAWAVLRSGSIWAGSLIHLINNGSIVLLASVPALRGMLSDSNAPPPLWVIPAGAVSLWLGLRVLSSLPRPDVGRALAESEEA